MNLELKECIKDAFDPAMKSFVESDDYKMARWEFNKMFFAFRNELPEELQKEFGHLMNARDDLEADLASEAYYRGVLNGISLQADIK